MWRDGRETDISGEPPRAQTATRFPQAHGDARWCARFGASPRQRPQALVGLRYGLTLDSGSGADRMTERSSCGHHISLRPDAAIIMRLRTIKRSSDFQRVRGGARVATPAFVIETKLRSVHGPDRDVRYGFTVTRKIGNAVVRNRIRRRLKEALRNLPADLVVPGHDYVIVARSGLIEQPFADLQGMLALTFKRLRQTTPKGRTEKPRHSPQADHVSRPTLGTAPSGAEQSNGAKPRNR